MLGFALLLSAAVMPWELATLHDPPPPIPKPEPPKKVVQRPPRVG